MGIFCRWRKAAPADWVPGTATIRVSQPHGEPSARETDGLYVELNHFGYRTHTFTLEVNLRSTAFTK